MYFCQVEALAQKDWIKATAAFGRGYSQLLVFSQANSSKLAGVFEIQRCIDKGAIFEIPKESQSEELEAADSAIFS